MAEEYVQPEAASKAVAEAPAKRIYSLRQVTRAIRKALDRATGGATWLVRAEVTKMSGTLGVSHVYLDLVDQTDNGTQAKMRGMIWSRAGAAILRELGEDAGNVLAVGREIVFTARIAFHESHGLSLSIERIELQHMLGEMERRRQATIHRLKSSGAMALNGRLPDPVLPRRIALVGSRGTSGYRDFVTKVLAPHYRLTIDSFQATVQGAGAPQSMRKALLAAEASEPDLIVLLRGGGSKMDLACFDDYELNVTISQLKCPVWTGIGHESDLSVADLCAHRAFKTPTDVAVGVTDCFGLVTNELRELQSQLGHLADAALQRRKTTLLHLGQGLTSHTRNALRQHRQRLGDWTRAIERDAAGLMRERREELGRIRGEMERLSSALFHRRAESLQQLQATLNALHPDRTLERGFCILRGTEGTVIKDAESLSEDDLLNIELRHHQIAARVLHWRPKTTPDLTTSKDA